MNSGQTGGRATFMNGEKVPLGRSCYKNWITPADLTVSGPQPLCPGNCESLKLSSPRGSSNQVSAGGSSSNSTQFSELFDNAQPLIIDDETESELLVDLGTAEADFDRN